MDGMAAEYYKLRAQARACFARFVDALNRRDTYDDLLHRPRYALGPERIAFLMQCLEENAHVLTHTESELNAYNARLHRLEQEGWTPAPPIQGALRPPTAPQPQAVKESRTPRPRRSLRPPTRSDQLSFDAH
jgi:hypothetical protein